MSLGGEPHLINIFLLFGVANFLIINLLFFYNCDSLWYRIQFLLFFALGILTVVGIFHWPGGDSVYFMTIVAEAFAVLLLLISAFKRSGAQIPKGLYFLFVLLIILSRWGIVKLLLHSDRNLSAIISFAILPFCIVLICNLFFYTFHFLDKNDRGIFMYFFTMNFAILLI